jgi:hypothetical protein
MIINVVYAGIISDAPTVSRVLYNVLQFILLVFGFLGIIGFVIAGIAYLTAAGDERRIEKAKKATTYSVIGIVIALGGWVLIKTIILLTS